MALDSTIQGGSSSAGKANVDTSYALRVGTNQVSQRLGGETPQPNFIGAVKAYCENDAGSITGSAYLRSPMVSEDNRLSVGVDTPLAQYNFTAGAQNTGDFKHAFTTMTMTQSAGFLNINPALATVSGNYAYLQSWKYFTLWGDGSLHNETIGQISAMPPANQILECGVFLGTAGVAPADGAFFRLTSAGLVGIVSYGGVETSTGVIVATLPSVTNGKYKIIISQVEVSFWINDALGAEIPTPAGQAVPYLWLNLPWCVMMRNSGTVTGGMTAKIGTVHVSQVDLNIGKPWSEIMGGQGNAYQGQEGDTQGSLAISPAAITAAAALSNSLAAANFVGLGGVALVLPTLTSGVDGILFSYLNPVATVTQPGKTLYVKGINVDSGVSTILAGGPLVYIISASFGSSLLTQATTADTGSFVTATVKAPRRVVIGMQCYLVTSAVGVSAPAVRAIFSSPIAVNPGEYFQILCRNMGTVTTTGAVAFTAFVDHYFE